MNFHQSSYTARPGRSRGSKLLGECDKMDQTFLVVPVPGEWVLWLVIDMEANL